MSLPCNTNLHVLICRRMAAPAPHITISVKRELHPFKHKESEARAVFANHDHPEDFLSDKHQPYLTNYQELKSLGKRPMLPMQKTSSGPDKWIPVRIEVEGGTEWVTLFLRNDNLYVKGFKNAHKSHEIVEKAKEKASKKIAKVVEERCGNRAVKSLENRLSKKAGTSSTESTSSNSAETNTTMPSCYNCTVLENWDVKYKNLFSCTTDEELEALFEEIAADPNFAVEAVIFLSKYIYRVPQDDTEKAMEMKAKRMLGGLIFLLCEYLRMDIVGNPTLGTFVEKKDQWGNVSDELLKWRLRNFTSWYTEQEEPKEKNTHRYKNFIKMGMDNGEKGLKLSCLILNKPPSWYRQRALDNKPHDHGPDDKDESKRDDKGNGGEGEEKGNRDRKLHGGRENEDGSQNTSGKSMSGGHSKGHGGGQEGGMEVEDGTSLGCGRKRIQILGLYANFEVDWINVQDWHRSQTVYKREIVEEDNQSLNNELKRFALVGPARAIGAYGNIGVKFHPTKARKGRTIEEAWNPWTGGYDDENVTYHTKDIHGENEHELLRIVYKIIPYSVEAQVGVTLKLEGERNSGYDVSGHAKAFTTEMVVHLFSHQTFSVPCNLEIPFPLMGFSSVSGQL